MSQQKPYIARDGNTHQFLPDLRPKADRRPVHHLSHAERDWLAGINRLLTEMTRSHHPCCPCELCEARVLTDTQDEAAYHVPYEPADCG